MALKNPPHLGELLKAIVPPLTKAAHKGQAGRIGIIGGCREYTGAPYYAAISALKVGADLSFVFCTEGAATPIKSYSPELIVIPALDGRNALTEVAKYSLHALLIGPGLGRDIDVQSTAKAIVNVARKRHLPLVIDADGIAMVLQQLDLVKDYNKAVLTPNMAEFSRLCTLVLGKEPTVFGCISEAVMSVSKALGNVTVVCKGPEDVISDGRNVLTCEVEGSLRRCGGQGDILSGALATFLHWTNMGGSDMQHHKASLASNMLAAYAACAVTRRSANLAFAARGRSMTAPNLIEQLSQAFQDTFEK